jgi:hypothetical protein
VATLQVGMARKPGIARSAGSMCRPSWRNFVYELD